MQRRSSYSFWGCLLFVESFNAYHNFSNMFASGDCGGQSSAVTSLSRNNCGWIQWYKWTHCRVGKQILFLLTVERQEGCGPQKLFGMQERLRGLLVLLASYQTLSRVVPGSRITRKRWRESGIIPPTVYAVR